jgi:hypothetical protein
MTGGWIDDVINMISNIDGTPTASISGNGIIKELQSVVDVINIGGVSTPCDVEVVKIVGELTPGTNAVNISNPQNSGTSSPADKTKSIQSLVPTYTNELQVLAGSGSLIADNKDKIALSNTAYSIDNDGRLTQP